MRILIDTHALIWFGENSKRLSKSALRFLEDENNEVYFSVVSIWEMTIKHQLGKLQLHCPLDEKFRNQAANNGMRELSIEFEHVVKIGELPLHHRDHFDRLLVGQAIVEGLSIISQDEIIDRYPVNRIW